MAAQILERDSRREERNRQYRKLRSRRLPCALRRRDSRLGFRTVFSAHRLKRLDRYAQFAVASAQLALDDAHLDYSREKPQHRVGVSFGTALAEFAGRRSIHPVSEKGRARSSAYACRPGFWWLRPFDIAIDFGFRGVGTTNSNSCASGTVSVGEALRYIRDDFADVIVAGGAEAPLTTITIGAFDIIKTMSRWPAIPLWLVVRSICCAMDSSWAKARPRSSSKSSARASAWHPHLCGSARLQPQQRCFPHDIASARRRIVRARNARRACRCAACA